MKISKERLDAEVAFTKCVKVMAYEPTSEVLDAVHESICMGVKPSEIVETLDMLKRANALK